MEEQDHKPTAELIKRALSIADPAERQRVTRIIRELQEVEANAEWLLEAEAVAKITGHEFKKRPDKDLVTQVTEYFNSIGGEIERKGIGMVILDRTGVKSSIGHKLGRKKAAAFAAVPDIIKNGIVIDHQANWKGRGYETYVIDAPLSIGGEDYIGEVVLTRKTGTTKFYLHEVETQEKLRGVSIQAGIESGTPLGASKLIIGKKLNEVKENISKIIDKNGELITDSFSKLTISDKKNKEAFMQIPITNQAEYDNAIRNKKQIGNELIIQNSSDFINVRTDVIVGKNGRCKTDVNYPITIKVKENGILAAEKNTLVIGHDNANIIAKGNCKVTLYDSAFGNCYEHCLVTLYGKSKISADGNCTVTAFDESSVSASGSSKVYTCQKATAKGTDVTALSGEGESTLIGQKNCSIKAKDNCIVYASDNCTVQAAGNCLVVADKNSKIVSKDNCLIMSNGKPDITVSDKCEHLNLDEVNDKNIMGALKQMAQSKAVVERPYVAIQILKENIPQTRREAVNRRLNTMGLKDQTATKNYLYSLIEAEPGIKKQTPAKNFERQLETARKTGYVQGVCECVAVVGNEQNLGKKLLSEMHVTKDMAKKFANPETYKTLEKGIFAQKPEHKLEQTHKINR